MKHKLLVLLLFSFGETALLQAQSLVLTPVTPNIPWLIGAEHAGTDRFYVIRQDGFIVIREADGSFPATPFLDWSANIKLQGEQGLLGLAFHPDYASNGEFFIYYSQAGTGNSVLSRMHRSAANPDVADPNSEEMLFNFPHPTVNHVGGCLKFGPDGYLYLTSGDGGELNDPNNNGQNNHLFLGKILRIDVDHGTPYAIPAGNPFAGNSNLVQEIWCTGLRNPWRMSFDRLSGDVWVGDVGQSTREEVDFIPAGSSGWNFGWSCHEGTQGFNSCIDTLCCFTDPVYEYPHNSNPNCSGSVTGGFVYRGYQYDYLWGKYIFTDFCSGEIRALSKDGNNVSVISLGVYNPFDYASFVEDVQGELYLAGYFTNMLYRISSIDCSPVARITGISGNLVRCPGDTSELRLEAYGAGVSGMKFQWFNHGVALNGDTSGVLVLHPAPLAGQLAVQVTNPANGCSAFSPVVNTTVIQPFFGFVDSTLHAGDVWQGVTVQHDTSFTRIFVSAINGCDSTVLYYAHILSAAFAPGVLPELVQISPNPAARSIELLLNLQEAAPEIVMNMADVNGRIVFQKLLRDLPAGISRTRVQLPELNDGVYIVTLQTGATASSSLLVIRNQ